LLLLCLFVPAAAQFASRQAHAVDEIQVYNASIAPVHTWSLEQYLNYVWSGSTTSDFQGSFAPYHSLNGTPELAYGVTPWYEIGFYAPFSIDENGTFYSAGAKVRHLFVSPNADERKFFYGLNVELSFLTPPFSQSPFGIEFRPILGVRDLGWEFIVNPIVDVSFGSAGSVDFAPALRLARSVKKDVMLGVEYYSNFGALGNFASIDNQQHTAFGVIDFAAFGLDVNFGVGFGLTDASDKIVTKLIVGRTF
jgi:hypothetical protein